MIECVNFVLTEKEAIDICNDFNACNLIQKAVSSMSLFFHGKAGK